MDLELSPRYVEFRDECRTWLRDNRPAEPLSSMDSAVGFEKHRLWERTLFEEVGQYRRGPRHMAGVIAI